MEPEASPVPISISERKLPKPAANVQETPSQEREKIERKFSQESREALIAKGCKIIEVGKNLSLPERKLLLRSMGAGLLSDTDVERELFSWPESSEFALLPELSLPDSNNKNYAENEAQMNEFSEQFQEEIPGVKVKTGTVAEYQGLEVSEKIKGNGSLLKDKLIRTATNVRVSNGEERNCIVVESNIDVWDKNAKDELLEIVPLIVPQ